MIFLSVGTQLPFDRMVKVVDDWCSENLDVEVIGQISDASYLPKSFKYEKYLPAAEFSRLYGKADIVISHAGMGNIITALEYAKPIIIFPRRFEFGEHRNDHQVSTVNKFGNKSNVYVVETLGELSKAVVDINSRQVSASTYSETNKELSEYLDERIERWFI